METQLQQTIVSLVAEHIGVALVPESMRKLAMAGVVFCELENAPTIEHMLVWQAHNLNPALHRLLDQFAG